MNSSKAFCAEFRADWDVQSHLRNARNDFYTKNTFQKFNYCNNGHSFIKSYFFGMQQFSFNPAGIFSLKDTLKIYKGKKNPQNPQALGFIIKSPL